MGHIPSLYLIQISEYAGTYKNPFKLGGRGVKWSKWKTIDMRNFLDEAKTSWKAYNAAKQPTQRYRVLYQRKTVINPEGRVYEKRADGYLYFVEEIA